jgi:hypothetical protein
VSGFRDPDGSLRATWIQRESGAAATQIAGFIGAVAANSLRVAGLQIDISGAALIGVTRAALAPGQVVRVVLQGAPIAGTAIARQLSLIDLRLPETVRKLHVQGIVDGWAVAAGRFVLNGQAVQIGAATQYEDGSLADLANGARVEVSGPRNDDGVLMADRIRVFRPLLTAYGRGKVSAVDIAGRSFTLFGIPGLEVRLRAATLLDDASASGGVLRLANLSAGDEVFVLGGDSGNRIDALLVQRLPRLTPGSGVGGPVSDIAGTTLTVLGIAVNTGSATQFYDTSGQAQTSAEFLAGLQTGDIVRAEGVQLGQALAALVVRRVR